MKKEEKSKKSRTRGSVKKTVKQKDQLIEDLNNELKLTKEKNIARICALYYKANPPYFAQLVHQLAPKHFEYQSHSY